MKKILLFTVIICSLLVSGCFPDINTGCSSNDDCDENFVCDLESGDCVENESSIVYDVDYYVSNTGNDQTGDGSESNPWKTIAKLNSESISSGSVVGFKSGDQFDDAVLEAREGVTYTSYGNGRATIGNPSSNLALSTVIVDEEDVTIDNLKIYGYANTYIVIDLSENNFELSNSEVIGGENAHDKGSYGIKQTNIQKGKGHKILKNTIRDLGFGIYIREPYNYEIAYNTLYNFYRLDGRMDYGGVAIHGSSSGHVDKWDTNYTLHIHHNDFSKWEYVAIAMDFSKMLVEYNVFHDNLDERIYRGGVKHTGLGKWWNSGDDGTTGSLGTIARYNYVYNIIRYGEPGYIYGAQTEDNVKNKEFITLETNNVGNGKNEAVYQYVVDPNGPLFEAYGNHFGDQVNELTGKGNGEGPDSIISGEGWANAWVHNNIFNNIYLSISKRASSHKKPIFREDLPSYFVSNTCINVGLLERKKYGVITSHAGSNSPHVAVNNIILASNPKTHYAVVLTERNYIFDNNLFPLQNGTVFPDEGKEYPSTSDGDNFAITFRYRAIKDYKNGNVPENNYYLTDPNWNNPSDKIFAPNIGPDGVWIPDVRLKVGGNAHNEGMDYDLIGDTYSDSYSQHELGKDPTGRSFAYDMLGNLRTTNDIGALGVVE